ncbi:sce7726 family protein [Mesorhizobium sp. M1217]|uniref:sce7726 family protein n=1 Tax=Mesorhizobium sp. M1217 TaxID=2957070 RepID=UPI003337A7AD
MKDSLQAESGRSWGNVEINTTQVSALTRLFSSTVFRELANKGRSPLLMRLLGLTESVARRQSDATVGDALEAAFALLKTAGMRNEYVYRSALTKKILMGKHSLRTASMLNEFRAGTCKADLVILNGTATAYEIKSERDSLGRLANQVQNYQKVFATVNVIASEDHIEGVRQVVPENVGIMCLSRRYQVSVEREAIDRPDCICPVTAFESLRSVEAAEVLKALGVAVPAVPNTQRHGVMRDLFAKLDPASLHREMVITLKRTRSLASLSDLIDQLPSSLHAAALSVPVRRSDHDRLVEAVATPLDAAMGWA